MIFEILPKTPDFQNVTDPKVPNQFSNLKMLWVAKIQMDNLYSKIGRLVYHSKAAKIVDFSSGLHKIHKCPDI